MKTILATAAVAFGLLCSTAANAAAWTYKDVTDPITDAKRGIAMLTGDGGTVVVKCDENGPDSIYLQIVADSYLGALKNKIRNVAVRLDDGEVRNVEMYHDGSSALIVDNNRALQLSAAMSTAKKIAMRLTKYDGRFVDILLTSDGSDANVRQAYATCGQRVAY